MYVLYLWILLSYVYTLRLIGPISYSGECDLWFTHESTSSFSHECILLPSHVYNMHQDTKSTRLIAVCKRALREFGKLGRQRQGQRAFEQQHFSFGKKGNN